MPRLTKRVVEAAEIRETQYTLWCSELRGFGVKINTAGTRSYFVDYRTGKNERRRMVLGRHGALTTDEARKLAIEKLADVIRGRDPQDERRARRQSPTVSELCDIYLEAARRGLIIGRGGLPKKLSTLEIDNGRIERHIKPLIGDLRVIDVSKSDITGFVRAVTSGKTAQEAASGKLRGRIRVSGGPGAAARAVGLLGGILTYAVSEGILKTNPSTGIRRPTSGRRDRRLTPSEYSALGSALRRIQEQGGSWQGLAIIYLVSLSGYRVGEVGVLRHPNLDLARQTATLNDSKTGRSIRPLGRAAVSVIESLPATSSDFLFPAPRLCDRPYSGIKRFYRNLFWEAGLPGISPHILRHSFASVAADLGFADSTIGACLGHAGRGTTSRYTHALDNVVVAAADTIANEINRMMGFASIQTVS